MKRLLLSRLQKRCNELLLSYMKDRGYTQEQLADQIGVQRTHLNAILNHNRPLSAYYVTLLVLRGIIKVDDLYDENPENEREQDFWEAAELMERVGLLHKIAVLEQAGIEIEPILDSMIKTLPPVKSKKN